MRNFILALLVGLPAVATAAPATTVTEARETLAQWFHGYEFVPEDRHYKNIGPHLAGALASLALDETQSLFVRARSISAMVYAPGPVTEPVLVGFAEAPAMPSLLRRKAVRVLADSHGGKYLDLVVSVYAGAGDDLPLREACAHALLDMPGDAPILMRDRLFRLEKGPTVKAILAPPKDLPARPVKGR